jgi:hypothetical protein
MKLLSMQNACDHMPLKSSLYLAKLLAHHIVLEQAAVSLYFFSCVVGVSISPSRRDRSTPSQNRYHLACNLVVSILPHQKGGVAKELTGCM